MKTLGRTLSFQRNKRFSAKNGPSKTLNIVTVGDGETGKTSLLMAFKNKPFNTAYVPTVFEAHTQNVTVEEQIIELAMWDTAGEDGYDRLRPLAYPHCDAFVICYAIDSPLSFYNVVAKWLPELDNLCPDVPRILVATKKDKRRRTLVVLDILNDDAPKLVSYEQGLCTAEKIGAVRFLETSALYNDGVQELFEHTTRVALQERRRRRKKQKEDCCIL